MQNIITSDISERDAYRIAERYGFTTEYTRSRRQGMTPYEALEDWDLI